MLPDEVISEIRERVDIVTLVGDYVRLVKRGGNHVGLCPFHAEKTPSFNVSAVHKFFHCFGCKESGDAFSFVMRMEGVSFPQAARVLAERAGVTIPETDREENAAERRERDRLERLYGLMEEACKFYEQQLREHPSAHVARAELERRGISDETALRFRLGYAPHAWDALSNHLGDKRADMNEAETIGLCARRRSGNGHYDRFRGRLMFPVRDLGGRVIAFSGRTLPDPAGAAAQQPPAAGSSPEPKYVNSPEGPLYSKGATLYGMHEARVELRRNGWALLCEGNFDLLSLHQAGFVNAVAPMGTALTATQAKLIARFGQRATLLFDGDAAGAKAVRAAFPLLTQHGLRGLVAQLPAGEDPDSYLRTHGAESLRGLLAGAQGIVEYLIDSAAEQAGASASESAAAVQSLVPVLQSVVSPVEMELYVQRVAQRFGLPDTTAVQRQLRASGRSERPASTLQTGGPADTSRLAGSSRRVRLPGLQQEVLGAFLDQPALFSASYAGEVEGLLTRSELCEVFQHAAQVVQGSGVLNPLALCTALGEQQIRDWVQERLSAPKYLDVSAAEDMVHASVPVLTRARAEQAQALNREILEARRSGDHDRAVQLTKQRDELRRSASGLLRRER